MKLFYKILLFGLFLTGISLWTLSNINSTKVDERQQNRTAVSSENGEENEEQKRINAEERWKAEFEMVKNPTTGKIPKGIRQKEVRAALKVSQFQLQRTSTDKTLPTITITERGPNNYGGRTRALGFDTRNTNIVLGGGVTSGIYRSVDGGTTWVRVTPAGVIHSLSCLAQDPRTGFQDTWYAGTGEFSSSANAEGASYLGHGIYKSTDNGLTWTVLTGTQSGSLQIFSTPFDFIARIVVNPNNGNVIASTSDVISHLDISTNTWTTVLGSLGNSAAGDVIYNASDDKFYAAIHGQDNHGGVYESTNGTTWTQVRTPQQLNPTGDTDPSYNYDVERIILANVANTDDIVVFFELFNGYSCNGTTSDAGLVHFDGSATWTIHTDKIGNCSNSYTATSTRPKVLQLQGGYNMALTTKPNDANIVYLAGTEAYRYNLSTNAYEFIGGSQLAANTINLHVDQHIFMFEPGSNDIMWAGNDGGLRKTDVTGIIKTASGADNGYDWTTRSNGYNGYQYYGVDIDPADGSNFIAGGAQDNAFTIHPTDATALEVGPTADGVDIAIISGGSDFTTHNLFFMWQFGSMIRQENGAYTTGIINPASTGFVGRFYLDADNTNYMYFPSSTGTLHRTRIAESIASSSTTGNSDTGWESMSGISTAVGSNEISALDASRDIQYGADYSATDANRKLYIGTKNGLVFRLDDPAFATAATTPVTITPTGASAGFVSDIAVNPLDDKEILVTYSNYGVNSVYHTSDASVASPVWTNIEGASGSAVELASARCAMITKEGSSTIYMVGTSTGLYATDALSGATTSWTRLGTSSDIGLAVSVEMRLRPSDNTIVLGTHGNGAFTLQFPTALPVELISFTGMATEKGNQLNWQTAGELNNKGFEVQKSTDGKTFERFAFVDGNGNSIESHTYELLDQLVEISTCYYRLKQIDFDDKFEYSDIISINNKSILTTQVRLYPNPIRDNLTIENGEGQVNIYSISGELVRQLEVKSTKQQVDVSDLAKGIYLLEIRKKDGTFTTHKIIK